MIAETEVYKDGHREVYHRAGTVDGRRDEKFVWTHAFEDSDLELTASPFKVTKATCVACTKNQIPPDVKKSSR